MKTDADGLAEAYPGARIINTYGPTEATLFCSLFRVRSDGRKGDRKQPADRPADTFRGISFCCLKTAL